MLQSKSRTWVEIELDKIKHNTKIIDELIGDTKIMAVVKANAYGHGDIEVACLLQDELNVDFFAVSSIDEALTLRENAITQRILVLGYTPEEHFHYLHEEKITQCLLSYEYAFKLNEYAREANVKIEGHIKVDTGMQRLGIPCIDAQYNILDVYKIYELTHVKASGIFSHFSVSDMLDEVANVEFTRHQIELFDRVLGDIKEAGYTAGLTHIHNSYGCLNYFDVSYDYARPGIILLGSTSDDALTLTQPIDLQPCLSWKANVSLVKSVRAGTPIGYGRQYVAKNDMKVATISVGYADGLPRSASHQGAYVLVHGVRCEIIGNICMDQCTIAVDNVHDVQEGDVVTLVGEDKGDTLLIDALSRSAHTINNDTFCMISKRVPRFYK